MCSVMAGLLLLWWCSCVVLAAMLLFVVVCCLVHVALLIHAFAVLIAFRSVCFRFGVGWHGKRAGSWPKARSRPFFGFAGKRKQAFFLMSRQNFKSLLARGWQAFGPKKSNDEQIYSIHYLLRIRWLSKSDRQSACNARARVRAKQQVPSTAFACATSTSTRRQRGAQSPSRPKSVHG